MDPYGAATKYARGNHNKHSSKVEAISKQNPNRPKEPFRNPQGQMSLFAYFNKQEPTAAPDENIASRSSLTEGHRDHQYQSTSISTRESEPKNCSKDEGEVKDKRSRTTFPRYPSINFSSLFYSEDGTCSSTNAAKLRCLLHYFDRVTTSSTL